MAIIELYIGNRLCDLEKPDNSFRFKRQFINPAEMSTKDAQKSYSITLPATANNNRIFGYTNIEETQGKFKIYDNAKVYVNGILIMDGKFMVTAITPESYTGNLAVPAPLTVKDIFGSTMMNQTGTWWADFKGVEDITSLNEMENSPCIFPLALYGLLPKYDETGYYYNPEFNYKLIYDKNHLRFTLKDFPPSVNVIQMLQKIFENAGYNLGGTAIDDERLKNLYVSYKNPEDYQMGLGVGLMGIKGTWNSYKNGRTDHHKTNLYWNNGNSGALNASLFNSKNLTNVKKTDPGTNISIKENAGTKNIVFKVPQEGLYKLRFKGEFIGGDGIPDSNGPIISTGNLSNPYYEVKVLRYSDDDYLEKQKLDNNYYYNNCPQNQGGIDNVYPEAHAVNFIDTKQNPDFICGFAWGGDTASHSEYKNPLVTDKIYHNPMAISGGRSWTINDPNPAVEKEEFRAFSAVESKGYLKIGDDKTRHMYNVELKNIPDKEKTRTNRTDNQHADGYISQVIWLEKDEMITIVSSTIYARVSPVWFNFQIDFDLSIEPFKLYKPWLTIDELGSSTAPMYWDDKSSVETGQINLIKFLPSAIKVDDWIDNFCKAFNLEVIDKGDKNFELNIKNDEVENRIRSIIDLDTKANVFQRKNESLKLPAIYELGFTADTAEEGYYETMEDAIDEDNGEITGEKVVNSGYKGGGRYETGSEDSKVLTQISNFSYCWYKKLIDEKGNVILEVPVISEHEIWEHNYDYNEMRDKYYLDKPQRFWYKSGLINITINEEANIKVALVSNEYKGQKSLILNYEDNPESIMKSFFLLHVNSKNDFTLVDCLLSPEEYNKLKDSHVKFNGDLYAIAEIDGYDPAIKNRGRLKLIRYVL